MMKQVSFPILVAAMLLLLLAGPACSENASGESSSSALTEKLKAAKVATNAQLSRIHDEWQIDKYPNFLKSCQMHKSSWEMLRLRFMEALISLGGSGGSAPFVISFTGSSVTAGHDSYFNQSYPVVAEGLLLPAFRAAGINLEVRNVAHGNNPCMPYDPCVGTIAGYDADIVHWEQSYNCFDQPMYEQFARQSAFLPKKPVVVYSESSTANWNEDECKGKKEVPGSDNGTGGPLYERSTPLTSDEMALLKQLAEANAASEIGSTSAAVEVLVSEMNKAELKKAFGVLGPIMAAYGGQGIESFTHNAHAPYACLGPYISSWKKGAAAWHPSVPAHKLRAAHHSFFWLLAFREAIDMLLSVAHKQSPGILLSEIETKRATMAEKHALPTKPLSNTKVPDAVQCYTDMVPRATMNHSISSLVVGGRFQKGDMTTSKLPESAWGTVIQEMLLRPGIIDNGLRHGQRDFKFVMCGNNASGPLSLQINPNSDGMAYICEANGVWGKLPAGFGHISEIQPALYLTQTRLPSKARKELGRGRGRGRERRRLRLSDSKHAHGKEQMQAHGHGEHHKQRLTSSDADGEQFMFDRSKAQRVDVKTEKAFDTCYELQTPLKRGGRYVLTIQPTSELHVSLIYVVTP